MGIAVAQPVVRRAKHLYTAIAMIGCFVGIANLPDWPLPNWGHHRYDISHSLFVNVGLIIGAYVFVKSLRALKYNSKLIEWVYQSFSWLMLAWLSHLLLDSFYSHGLGVGIGWPINEWRLVFPIPCFDNVHIHESILSEHNLKVVVVELLFYLPIVVVVYLLSRNGQHSNG